MGFIIFVIIILLGLGAWFYLVQMGGLGMNGKSIRDFILQKHDDPEPMKPLPPLEPTTLVVATSVPVQLPPVFSAPPALTKPEPPKAAAEQPKEVNTPAPVPTTSPMVDTSITLRDNYPSFGAIMQAARDFPYAVLVDGKVLVEGKFGPPDEFVTLIDGSIIRGRAPTKVEEQESELKVDNE